MFTQSIDSITYGHSYTIYAQGAVLQKFCFTQAF